MLKGITRKDYSKDSKHFGSLPKPGASRYPEAMPAARKMTLVPLMAAIYFLVAGGPYGLEDVVSKSGYFGALVILLVTPAIWSLPAALMVAELASALPNQGGYYVWVSRGMGRFWGFQEAWLSLAGSVFDVAIYPTLFVSYLGRLAPSLTAGARGLAIGVALIAASALSNLFGAKSVGVSSVFVGAALLAPFVMVTGYACFHRTAAAAAPLALSSVDILGGVLVAMWNYMGWDGASPVADEVDRPQRTYPRAMSGSVALVALTYTVPVAAVALTGLDLSRWSTGAWADVARAVIPNRALGFASAVAITIGGMLGAWGTLNAQTMQYSRLPAVMADDRLLPPMFSRRWKRTGAPWVAIVSCAAIWVFCLGLSFVKLVVLDVLLTGLSLLLEFAALVALRIREPQLTRPFRVPGGLAGAIGVGVPPAVLLLLTAVRNRAEPIGPMNGLQLGVILIATGVPAYFLSNGMFKRARTGEKAVSAR
jgi:amino acid transporter